MALQLELLRVECERSWDELSAFFPKVTDGDPLQGLSLKTEIKAVLKEAVRFQKQGTDADFDAFLSVNLGTGISARNVGPHLFKHRILRQHLINPDMLSELAPPSELNNGMIIDLMIFLTKEILPLSGSRQTLEFLGANVSSLTDKQLLLKLNKVMTTYKSLNKSIKRSDGQQKMDTFLESPPAFGIGLANVIVPTVEMCPVVSQFPTPVNIAVATAERKAASLRRLLEDKEKEVAHEKEKNVILMKQSISQCKDIQSAEGGLSKSEKKNTALQEENARLQQQLLQTRQVLQSVKKSNVYKRLNRKEKQLNRKEAILRAHETGRCERTERSLRRQIKLLQTQASHKRAQLDSLHEKADQKHAQLEQVIQDLLRHDPRQIQTRKEKSEEFTDEVKKTTIALIAAQVSAHNCPRVIQTVAKYLFDIDIALDDLPSERTVRRYADQGHVLAKLQVAEAIVSDKFDLHVDGTTRDKKKYVGQQVTTSEGSLSCGFTPVATENAATLVETTLNLLQEISEVFSEEEKQEHFLRILRNLSGVMSDRATVMKRYKEDLNQAIQATLGTDESIEFLFCNAHFLLGLSSMANTCLNDTQKELGESRIGRDLQQQFQRFSTPDAAAVRYVRMACEVLGPRGDDKNGCRDAWLAYCSIDHQPSLITSFKSNRFNNLFEAAAALHFHRSDIIKFLSDFMPQKNKKLESVLSDAQSDKVAVYVLTLAMIFYRITGPYWQVLGSHTQYLDFYQHVVELQTQLKEWMDDASTIFWEGLPSLFGRPTPNNNCFRAALSGDQETKNKVANVFQKVCASFVIVLERQLTDFLSGGRYHEVNDPALRQKLAHSHITNLLGEACFGDLDLSIYKRRNASCHHHSSLTMMIRNKTMDKWFCKKDPEAQKQLLKLSAKKGPGLRKKHREEDREVTRQRKIILQQHRQQQEEREKTLAQKKAEIIRKLQDHAGPCRTPADVDRMIQQLHLQRQRKEALQLEINYHKTVLGVKSPLLRTSQGVNGLVDSLKQYLQHLADQDPQQQNGAGKKSSKTYFAFADM